jgi:hypothetical protein
MATFGDRLRERSAMATMEGIFGENLLRLDRILSPSIIARAKDALLDSAAHGKTCDELLYFEKKNKSLHEDSILSFVCLNDEERDDSEKFAQFYYNQKHINVDYTYVDAVTRTIMFFRFEKQLEIKSAPESLVADWKEPVKERYNEVYYEYFLRSVDEMKCNRKRARE